MIDVIIPAYRAQKTIHKTIASIAMQSIAEQLNVVIVNDKPGDKYKRIIESFKNVLKIKVINMKKNGGPGAARQFGLDSTKNDFVVFIDADDTFYNAFAIEALYKHMQSGFYNIAVGVFVEEFEREGRKRIKEHARDATWLHGKMYERRFLEKHNIRFNDSRANEDSGFNALCNLCGNEENIIFLEDKVYIWHNNKASITRSTDYFFEGMEGFAYNQAYAAKKAAESGVSADKLARFSATTICTLYLYYLVLCSQNRDETQLNQYISWAAAFYNDVYIKYLDHVTEDMMKEQYTAVFTNNAGMVAGVIPQITLFQFAEILANYDCS